MKSLLVALGLVFLAGCALDIPAPAPLPPATKPDYPVVSDGGRVVKWYNGNDVLQWIERHELFPGTSADDPRIRTYHSSAADVLQWYEYRRFETVEGVWVKTRERRFVTVNNTEKDKGTWVFDKAWSYIAPGLSLLSVQYDVDDALVSYSYNWAEVAANNRVLQTSNYDAAGSALSYDRTWFEPGITGKKTARLVLDGTLATTSAQTFSHEGDNLVETLKYSKNSALWTREQRSFLPTFSYPYRTLWYQVLADTAPASATFEVGPSAAAPALVLTGAAAGSLPAATLPTPTASLVALPTLNQPTSWPLSTLQGFEYVLPGADGGTTTLRFNKDRLPLSLVRAAQGTLGAMNIEFDWDAEKRLAQRLVSYRGNAVLTVDLHRDAQGRVDRVDSTGSILKLPLTYTLAYADATATRPDTLTLLTPGQNLLTLSFTYDDKTAAVSPNGAGLDALTFDAHVKKITVGVDAGADLLNVLDLEFSALENNTATVDVYDVLNKVDDARKLIGTLTWSLNADLHQTGLVWNRRQPDNTLKTEWTYTAGWGTWATLADGMVTTAEDWGQTLEATASKALSLADSLDVEKILQLVNVAQAQPSQAQFQRMATNLFDQIKAASGN